MINNNKITGVFFVEIKRSLIHPVENNSKNIEEIKLNKIKNREQTTISGLSKAIEKHDAYTKKHCDRVKEYALKLGERMGLNAIELKTLEYAAILHDIGKVGIPSELLQKSQKLTKDEYQLICEHPSMGAEILKDITYLNSIPLIIEQHHERVDGGGYPRGLIEADIHPFAQILCITDAYDAMTTDRPYKQNKMTNREAIEELRRCAGLQFSVEKVEIFIQILQDEEKNKKF